MQEGVTYVETTAPGREASRAPGGGSMDSETLERLATRLAGRSESPAWLSVEIPFTGEVLGRLPCHGPPEVNAAARRARAAQPSWAGTPLRERSAVVLRFHDLLIARQADVLDLIQLESGKARAHGFEEVGDVALVARYYAIHGRKHLRVRRRKGAIPGLTAAWEERDPVGLVGLIAPWNYPLSLSAGDAIPALLAGNAVLLKPDPKTPFTALWAADLLHEAGLPPDLLQIVAGDASTGAAVVEEADYIAFTGSASAGRSIARRAGERLIGCSLELGGKNAMIVLADADLDAAARGAVRGAFANAGQLCIGIERLCVVDQVADAFLERFIDLTRSLRLGAGLDFGSDIGSLASREQLQRVRAHVEGALMGGARLLAGGRHRPEIGPYFFEPTILADVHEGMQLCREETFGPVVAVYRVETVDEAIELANGTAYGLNASIWTRRTSHGRRLASRIQAGTVNINEAYAAAWGSVDAPMGGMRDSGIGRRHGREGIQKFTESRTVAVQRLLPLAAPSWLGEERYSRLLSRLLRLLRRVPGLR